MSKVYIVQQHLHRDSFGVLVPKHDLRPASQFGELVYCLKPDDNPNDPRILEKLRRALSPITAADYILPIGSTVLMVLTGIVAAEYVGKLNFLYWNGHRREYRVTSYDLDANDPQRVL